MRCLNSIFLCFFLIVPIASLAQNTLSESSQSVTVDCRIFGQLVDKSQTNILNGSLEVDEDLGGINKIPAVKSYLKNLVKDLGIDDICIPAGVRSELFGNPKGLQLKITAWKCIKEEEKEESGIDALYFSQKIYLNHLKDAPAIVSYISPEGGRISLNEDPTDLFTFNIKGERLPRDSQEQKPIVLPEGQFSYIYSDCNISQTSQ